MYYSYLFFGRLTRKCVRSIITLLKFTILYLTVRQHTETMLLLARISIRVSITTISEYRTRSDTGITDKYFIYTRIMEKFQLACFVLNRVQVEII